MNKKSENSQKNQRIQVFARCRPLNSIEKKQFSPSVVDVIPDKKIVVKDRNANREFLFDKVFPPDTKQISVYKAVVEPLIQEVLMGYNCTVFAYGQTGTGKTYTMEGERSNSQCSWEDDPGTGIIPRSLHQLFEDLNHEENVEFSVRVSFLELYNEELFDLLSSDLSKLRLYEDSSKKVIIHGLDEIIVNSKDEVYSILEKGTARRQTAATMLNASSSRSHTVFSVTVHIKENTIEGEELLKTGKLNLVDLAGSENVGRSGAVDKRAREAGNINQSLLTLGRVITALIEKQPHVPYRESKLTRLLQDSLGGHTKTSIIATISPALCNFDETISTLDYANKAKSITINPEVNQKMTKRALIREYTEEIEKMRRDLVALRSKDGFYIDQDNYTNLMNEINVKSDMIKELSDKVEILKEENSKIEEMFILTKEELTVTSEKLNQTSKKYEKTAADLSNTQNALNCTQQVLTDTTLERDEKQFLINIQKNTEKKLSHQAHKLLTIADETTSDVEKLHSKIDRKNIVEKTNEERCRDFRIMCQKQFALLVDIVSNSEKQQAAVLTNIKSDIDKLTVFFQGFKQQNEDFLNNFITLIESKCGNISLEVRSGVESQTKSTNMLLEATDHQREIILKKQNSFLLEMIPEIFNHMNSRNSEMEKWVTGVNTRLSEEIENKRCLLSENSENRKKLIISMKESLESFCKASEDIVEDFKLQKSSVSIEEENLDKDHFNELQELKFKIQSIEKIEEKRKDLRKRTTKRDGVHVSRLEDNVLVLQEVKKPLTVLQSSEDILIKDVSELSSLSSIMNMQDFSEQKNNVYDSQQRVVSEFEIFLKEHQQDEEKLYSETECCLKNNLSLMSENLHSIEKTIAVSNSCIKDFVNSGKTSFATQLGEVEKVINKTGDGVNESQAFGNSTAIKFKDEILKRDIELEKFISDDLIKDIPTGTTPQRKNYSYPRYLTATSPHDRILQRYRSQLAADTAIAINLPLNSSFNELDELKESPLSTDRSNEAIDLHNASVSSDDSVDTDSCASSVSDVSVDGGKNKENRSLKNRSRLPKRLPSSKVFLKPAAPLTSRKPLVAANNVLDQS